MIKWSSDNLCDPDFVAILSLSHFSIVAREKESEKKMLLEHFRYLLHFQQTNERHIYLFFNVYFGNVCVCVNQISHKAHKFWMAYPTEPYCSIVIKILNVNLCLLAFLPPCYSRQSPLLNSRLLRFFSSLLLLLRASHSASLCRIQTCGCNWCDCEQLLYFWNQIKKKEEKK